MVPWLIRRVVVERALAGKAKLTKRSVARIGANLARRENHSIQQHSRNLGSTPTRYLRPTHEVDVGTINSLFYSL